MVGIVVVVGYIVDHYCLTFYFQHKIIENLPN